MSVIRAELLNGPLVPHGVVELAFLRILRKGELGLHFISIIVRHSSCGGKIKGKVGLNLPYIQRASWGLDPKGHCHTCDSSTLHICVGPNAGPTMSYSDIQADRPWQTEIRNGLPAGQNGFPHRCLI